MTSKLPTNPIISEDEIKDVDLARLSKVWAHNIEELHLHSGKQGRGGRKQSGTAKRSNDPNVSSENWSTVKQSMEMLLKLTVLIAKEILDEEPMIEYRPPFLNGLELDAFFQKYQISLEVQGAQYRFHSTSWYKDVKKLGDIVNRKRCIC
ncbi:unnamed protein product [Rhizophagus irregularis]|nr:unnamed protein product [Rhizophagus irregularis]